MAISLVLQGILAALCAVLGAVLWRLVPYLLAPFQSSLLNLPGPPSPGWLFGSLNEIYESDGDLITDEWIEKYGSNVMYRGLFNVGTSLFRRGSRLLLTRRVSVSDPSSLHYGYPCFESHHHAFHILSETR